MGPLPVEPVPPVDDLMESRETVTLHQLPNQDQGHAAGGVPAPPGGGGPPEERGAERYADTGEPRLSAPRPCSGLQSSLRGSQLSPPMPIPSEPSEAQQIERLLPR